MRTSEKAPHPLVLLIAGWVVPGLAHWMLGKRGKAILFFVLLAGTFTAGMALANFRNVYYEPYRWTTLTQIPAGAVALAGTQLRRGGPNPEEEERELFKVGTLYTSVAGLLNIVVMMDAAYLGWTRRRGEKR